MAKYRQDGIPTTDAPPPKKYSVSRIDHLRTHGYLARVYRSEWVGSRSFADGRYNGKSNAEAVALVWVELADKALPIIEPKPEPRKASVHVRRDEGGHRLYYFDVYLPSLEDDGFETEKLHYSTDDERIAAQALADGMVNGRNRQLQEKYRNELAMWYVHHDEVMAEIEKMWPALHDMPVEGGS